MDQIADKLPKLMPIWHDQSTHGTVNIVRRFLENNLPDFGGIGIDISMNENLPLLSLTKHVVDRVHFKAQVCALPFVIANRAPKETDPCLNSLNTSRENLKRFCVKLECLRSQMKLKRCENHKNEILSAYKKVQKMCKSGNYAKILLPEVLIELAIIFPKTMDFPNANLNYPGCLASSNKATENPILLYPTGKKLTKLAITTLEHSSDPCKMFQPVDSVGNVIKLEAGCIQQIKCAFDGYCYVIQDKLAHFVNFTDPSNISCFRYLTQSDIKNIEASQYCPVELISLNENGMMKMINIDEKKTLWSAKNSFFSEGFGENIPLSCAFGSHPKSVLCITDRMLHSFDTRIQDHRGCVIFSSDHPSCYINEYLTCMKGSLTNPFQYFISSSHHLFLCDERYAKKPVLLWNHLLKDSPIYCDIAPHNMASDVVLLGTQKSRELALFSVNSTHSSSRTVSLGPPIFLSSPSDCISSLKFHCVDIDEKIEKRLSYPLSGITALPHSNQTGFTAFQITSPGDLFYQDFTTDLNTDCQVEERTYRADIGCVLTPPCRIWPHLSNWNKIFKKHQIHKSNRDVGRISVNVKDILYKQNEVSSVCCVCAFYKLEHNREVISSDSCPTCGLKNFESEPLIKAANEISLLVGPTTEDCNLSQFDTTSFFQFTDSYSKKILQAWSLVEETEQASTETQSQDDFGIFSPASSYANTSTRNLQLSFQDISNISSQQQTPNAAFFLDETMVEVSMYSQGSMEEFIPPSQNIRPIVGETLRTPKRIKTQLSKKATSSAGF